MSARRQHREAKSIFISYSRGGGQAHAVSLYQGLVQVLGEKGVFLDVGREAMEAGRSWKESVREALAMSDTLLLVFDPGMAARFAEPENAVLFELETALENEVTIACVRVDGAEPPPASALPPSLGGFSEWHSPEVHSDAAVADIERVIKELTGRVPGQIPVVDRWDLIVFGLLATLGLAAWLSVGRSVLNPRETWLWATMLAIPWLIWMTGRRAMPIGNRGRASLSYRQAASWLVVLAVFVSGWLLARKTIYRLPELSAESGVLVARLAGDPDDSYQKQLALSLGRNKLVSPDVGRVALLPRRVGFSSSIDLAGYLDNGHQEARGYGLSTRAAVVLWGKLLAPAEALGRLAVNLTFIESEALFKTFGSEVVGAMEAREVNDLDSNLDRLAKILPRFLEGYRLYHAAESEREFGLAEHEFSIAIESLEATPTTDPRDRKALDEILASLHFYRGNTFLILGRKDRAALEYRAAVSQTAEILDGREYPRYVEAASNLGWLLMNEGKLDEAVAILAAVDPVCEGDGRPQRACAYAWYNLGDAFSDQGRHEDASDYFELAIERIRKTGLDTEDRRLEAFCHQNRAYSLVRRAVLSDASGKDSLLEEAQEAWQHGVSTLEGADLEVPEYFRITLGRIHIERRRWREAIEVLEAIEVPSDRQGSLHALLAGAFSCLADLDRAGEHLQALLATGGSGPESNGFRISTSEGMDEVGRIQKMCREAPSPGA